MRLFLVAFLFFLSLGCANPIVAQKPPRARKEIRPGAPGPKTFWKRGHWAWKESDKVYYWVPGTWALERSGYIWLPGRWEPVNSGGKRAGWRWADPRWERTDTF